MSKLLFFAIAACFAVQVIIAEPVHTNLRVSGTSSSPNHRRLSDETTTAVSLALSTRLNGNDIPEGGCESVTGTGYKQECLKYGNCYVSYSKCKFTENRYLKVLFIGNSFTSRNGMPKLFRLISSRKGKRVRTGQATHGGATFRSHYFSSTSMGILRQQQWDVVVVQEQSRILAYPFDKYYPVSYAEKLKTEIEKQGALMILYQTWGYREGHSSQITGVDDNFFLMSRRLQNGYQELSQVLNVPIVPVGRAWEIIMANRGDDQMGSALFDPDKMHPRKTGSYVAACTFFAEIFGETAKGARGFSGITTSRRYISQLAATEAVGL